MRILPNLNDINECPNCGSPDHLRETENEFGRHYLICINCHEEIYEDENTRFEEKAEKEKETFIFEMREEISNLDWCSHDSKTQILVENIQNIFNKIIDYIEEN